MIKHKLKILAACSGLILSMALAPALAFANEIHAQNRICLPIEMVNDLVHRKQIISFNQVKKMLQLARGSKVFNQKLCQINGELVYFFKIVDRKGRARAIAIYAADGRRYPTAG